MEMRSKKSVSFAPALARTGSTRAVMEQSSTSPIAARTRPIGRPHGNGSIAVIDFPTNKVEHLWPIPGGGSPDMGNVSTDGKQLWLSGRWDNVVYDIDTTTGAVKTVRVGLEPHGLTVWPQPGRYSLGHTGNMR